MKPNMKNSKRVKFFAAAIIAIAAAGHDSLACTNVLITRGASADGSCMISYAADSHQLFGELYFRPAADWEEGSMLKIYNWDTGYLMGEIPQASHTYQTVGNMNEHQLIIAETTYGGREELWEQEGAIRHAPEGGNGPRSHKDHSRTRGHMGICVRGRVLLHCRH